MSASERAKPDEGRQRFEKQAQELRGTLAALDALHVVKDDYHRNFVDHTIEEVLRAAERDTRELCAQELKEMADEIGDHVGYHIESMYPQAVEHSPKSFLLSVRNFTSNKLAAVAERIRGKGESR